MGTRSKLILRLAQDIDEDLPVALNNPDPKTVNGDETVDDQQTTQNYRHRSVSTSSSSLSTSCSSFSSSLSFSEDSDDSVKDPDSKEFQEKRRPLFSLDDMNDDVPTAATSQQTTNQEGRSGIDTVIFIFNENPIDAPAAMSAGNQSPPIEPSVVAATESENPPAIVETPINEMNFAVFNKMNFAIYKDEDQKVIKTSEVKGIRVLKDDPHAIYYRSSYADEMKRAIVIKKSQLMKSNLRTLSIEKWGWLKRKKRIFFRY